MTVTFGSAKLCKTEKPGYSQLRQKGLEPYGSLVQVFKALPYAETGEQIEVLLP